MKKAPYALLRGVESRYLDDIDEILTENSVPTVEPFGISMESRSISDSTRAPRRSVWTGGDLRALYSDRDLYEEEWDGNAIERWRECGLFSSAAWEEDEARSRADEEQARELLQGFFFDDP